jgi:hypothetical protein
VNGPGGGGRRINMQPLCEVVKRDGVVQVENLENGEAAN